MMEESAALGKAGFQMALAARNESVAEAEQRGAARVLRGGAVRSRCPDRRGGRPLHARAPSGSTEP